MADPHVRRYLGHTTTERTYPDRWRSGCCASEQWDATYVTEDAAVAALADHLEAEHRMAVRMVTVLDLSLISTATGGYKVIADRPAAVPITVEVSRG